jgi:hypothetical protein
MSSDQEAMERVERELIAALAEDVVRAHAPEELPLLRATAEAYFETPEAVLRRVIGKDETLGFGASDVVALAPYALTVASAVVTFLAQQAIAVTQEAGAGTAQGLLERWIDRLRGRRPDDDAFTAEQLRKVRDVAYSKAIQLGLPSDEATVLADATAGGIATGG